MKWSIWTLLSIIGISFQLGLLVGNSPRFSPVALICFGIAGIFHWSSDLADAR